MTPQTDLLLCSHSLHPLPCFTSFFRTPNPTDTVSLGPLVSCCMPIPPLGFAPQRFYVLVPRFAFSSVCHPTSIHSSSILSHLTAPFSVPRRTIPTESSSSPWASSWSSFWSRWHCSAVLELLEDQKCRRRNAVRLTSLDSTAMDRSPHPHAVPSARSSSCSHSPFTQCLKV